LSNAVEIMRILDLPFGVVVNRAAPGRDNIRNYCEEEKIEILAEVPDDRRVAEAYSRGELAVKAIDAIRKIFINLLEKLNEHVASSPAEGFSGSMRRKG